MFLGSSLIKECIDKKEHGGDYGALTGYMCTYTSIAATEYDKHTNAISEMREIYIPVKCA